MKTKKFWIVARLFILFLVASTINSKTIFAEDAVVTATTIAMTTEPKIGSSMVTQLRQGDAVRILEKTPTFAKVEYKIEGDFPVQGWLPLAALNLQGSAAQQGTQVLPSQTYIPKPKDEKIVTQVDQFPDQNLKEQVTIPKSQSSLNALGKKSEANKEAPDTIKIKSGTASNEQSSWKMELQAGLGYFSWSEKLKTKNPATGAAFSSYFLDYKMTGSVFDAKFNLAYDFDPTLLGVWTNYRFVYFSDSVGSNANINQGNVQAQIQEFLLGPFLRYPFHFSENSRLDLDIRVLAAAQFFITNQLSSTTLRQPILFNMTTYYLKAELAPKYIYRNFFVEPQLGAIVFSTFTEGPLASAPTEAERIRTGSPKSSSLLLQYGLSTGYHLTKIGFPKSEIYTSFNISDFSRSYSGLGNRAGIQMSEASSKTTTLDLTLGIRHKF